MIDRIRKKYKNTYMAHVLLVDDNPVFLQRQIRMLEEEGRHTVDIAANLAEAIRSFRQGMYPVIVLDKNIGGHRGCVPFIEQVRRERPDTKIILHSGEESWHVLGLLGCQDFVSKGTSDRRALLNAVNRWAVKSEEAPKKERKSYWDQAYGEDYFADRL